MIDEYDLSDSFDRRSPPVIQEEEEEDPTFGNNKIINLILENSPFDDERITFAVASIALLVFVSLDNFDGKVILSSSYFSTSSKSAVASQRRKHLFSTDSRMLLQENTTI